MLDTPGKLILQLLRPFFDAITVMMLFVCRDLCAVLTLPCPCLRLGQAVDDAVTRVIEERGELPQRPLTAQDVFFRHLSAVEDIIGALVERQAELVATGAPPRDLVQLTSDTNTILVVSVAALVS